MKIVIMKYIYEVSIPTGFYQIEDIKKDIVSNLSQTVSQVFVKSEQHPKSGNIVFQNILFAKGFVQTLFQLKNHNLTPNKKQQSAHW